MLTGFLVGIIFFGAAFTYKARKPKRKISRHMEHRELSTMI